MKLKEIVTNIDLSKQLEELGVSQKAENYFYWWKNGEEWEVGLSESGKCRSFSQEEYRAFSSDEIATMLKKINSSWKINSTASGFIGTEYSRNTVSGYGKLADTLGWILVDLLKGRDDGR